MMDSVLSNVIPLILALILDAVLGDPENLPHPVVYMGNLISFLRRKLLVEKDTDGMKLRKGMILTASVVIILLLIGLAVDLVPLRPLRFILKTIVFFYCLARRTLQDEAIMVEKALSMSLESGRARVGRIVGRDPEYLDEKGVIRATVETVAENSVDGVTAPMIYALLFGAAGILVYKGVNTLDSMVGYKNERYLYFGRPSARFDDVLNYIPSRITAVFSILCAPLARMSLGNAFRVFQRDRRKHASPNSAQTESVYSGAMGIRLAGPAYYEGRVEEKEYLNEEGRNVVREDISASVTLMNYTVLVMTAVILLSALIIGGIRMVTLWMNL